MDIAKHYYINELSVKLVLLFSVMAAIPDA